MTLTRISVCSPLPLVVVVVARWSWSDDEDQQRTEAKTHLENLLKNPHTPRGSWSLLLWPYNRWHGHQPKTDSIRFDTGHTSSMSKRCGRAGRLFLTECDAVVGNISGIRSWTDRRLGVCNKKPWAHGQHLEESRKKRSKCCSRNTQTNSSQLDCFCRFIAVTVT